MMLGLTIQGIESASPATHFLKEPSMQQVFEVQGMTCGHCERAVTNAIQGVDAQAQVKIDRAAKRVEVQSDAKREELSAAIAEEGYQVA